MKQLLGLFLYFSPLLLIGQNTPCDLDYEIQNDSVQVKRYHQTLIYELDMGKNGESLFANLIEIGDTPLLEIQYIQKSTDFIPLLCFDRRSMLSIQLLNGTVVSLRHFNTDICSNFIYDKDQKNIRVINSYFKLEPKDFDILKASKISMIRIRFLTDIKTYSIKNELYSNSHATSFEPALFFQKSIPCLQTVPIL